MTELLFDKNVLEINENVYNFNSKGILFPEVGNNLILRPLSADDYEKGDHSDAKYYFLMLSSRY